MGAAAVEEQAASTFEAAVGEEIDRGVTIEELRSRFAATLEVIQVERERAGMQPLITWDGRRQAGRPNRGAGRP